MKDKNTSILGGNFRGLVFLLNRFRLDILKIFFSICFIFFIMNRYLNDYLWLTKITPDLNPTYSYSFGTAIFVLSTTIFVGGFSVIVSLLYIFTSLLPKLNKVNQSKLVTISFLSVLLMHCFRILLIIFDYIQMEGFNTLKIINSFIVYFSMTIQVYIPLVITVLIVISINAVKK